MAPPIQLLLLIAGGSVKPDAIDPPSPTSPTRLWPLEPARHRPSHGIRRRQPLRFRARPRRSRGETLTDLRPSSRPPTANRVAAQNPQPWRDRFRNRARSMTHRASEPPTRRRPSAPPHRRKPRPSGRPRAAGPPRAHSPSGPPPATRASSITFSASPYSPRRCRTCSDSRGRRSWSSTAARR